MAVGVVDALEAVDVADQQRARRCRRRARGGRCRSSCGGCAGRSGRRCGRRPRGGRRPRRGRRWRRRGDARPLGDLVEQFGARRRGVSSAMPSSVAVDLVAGEQVRDRVGDLDAGGLAGRGRRARSGRRGGRRSRCVTVVVGLGQADQQRAGGGVVEAEALALQRGARRRRRAPRRRSPRAPTTPNAAGISSLPTSCSRPARWAVSVWAPRSSAVVAA